MRITTNDLETAVQATFCIFAAHIVINMVGGFLPFIANTSPVMGAGLGGVACWYNGDRNANKPVGLRAFVYLACHYLCAFFKISPVSVGPYIGGMIALGIIGIPATVSLLTEQAGPRRNDRANALAR